MQAASGPVLKAQHRRVRNALSQVLLAGVHQADKLQQALDAEETHAKQQLVVAFLGSGEKQGTFAGVYAMEEVRAPTAAARCVKPTTHAMCACVLLLLLLSLSFACRRTSPRALKSTATVLLN